MPTPSPERHGEEELPEHVVEELLASRRRELMLAVLAERSAPVVLDDVVRTVLAAERDVAASEISREACATARREAYEEHLPKLTAVDVVRYDSLVDTLELVDETVVEDIEDAS